MKRRVILTMTLMLAAMGLWAQADYKMAGPYEIVARDGKYARTKGGSERDMWAALQCALKWQQQKGRGAEAIACKSKALEIIDGYAAKLQRFDGHDAPLCAIQGYWLLRAMIIMKENVKREEAGEAKVDAWRAMVYRAMLPTIERFEAASPYANGNWGAIVNRLRMACGVFLEDSVVYQAAVDYFLTANDNGSLPRYVSPTGQCQETGRDQGHAQLGLGALCETCELAWMQGTDLWGALDNRLMRGLEYTARYNLGHDVPFERWTDCTGLYNDWTEPGAMGRGRIRTIYDAAYQHYTKVKHQKMPYVKQLLALQRKAEKEGRMKYNPEANQFQVEGVTEGVKLHQIFTYAAPEGAPLKQDFDVFVRPINQQEWTKIDTYMAKVKGGEMSYAYFDFTGDVLVKVVCMNKKYKNARIRPDYRGTICNQVNDSTVQFLLFQPENVSVEFQYEGCDDYDLKHNLFVFTAKPPVTKEQAEREAKAEGRQFVYVPARRLTYLPLPVKEGVGYLVPSNTTVYLEGGSYLDTTLAIEDAENVTILGRGIARPANGYEGCHVYRSKNVVVDGLIVNTCPIGESSDIVLRDVRSISHPQWGDGLNVFGGSERVLFDRVFCRNSDDCTTVYATRKGFKGSVRDVRMTNSTLWADVAHPIFIGLHGDPEVGDSIVHLRYDNIDIIYQNEQQVEYQGALAINCGDGNKVRDVVFDNIRIEGLRQGGLVHVRTSWNDKYCTAPGGSVEDVTFRTIRYYGQEPVGMSVIDSYDTAHPVRNIRFEDFRLNGRRIYDDMPSKPRWHKTTDYVPMYIGTHTEQPKFYKTTNLTN